VLGSVSQGSFTRPPCLWSSSTRRTPDDTGDFFVNAHYNRVRPHRSLGRRPPLSRLAEMNNLIGTTPRVTEPE
jgi:hypothetical protein